MAHDVSFSWSPARETDSAVMSTESSGVTTGSTLIAELFTKGRNSPLSCHAHAVLVRYGFDVAVRDTSNDAKALADLCWLDGSPLDLPLVVIWQGERVLAKLGRHEILSAMGPRLRHLDAIWTKST